MSLIKLSAIVWLCKAVFLQKEKKAEAFEVESDWRKPQCFRFSGNLREKLLDKFQTHMLKSFAYKSYKQACDKIPKHSKLMPLIMSI